MRILVVEDEQKVANALREGLQGERYDVVVERTGEGAFFRMTTEQFDAILLDLTLPGRDGIEILKAMRDRGMKTPVLVLTARDTVQDRIVGLDSGADDYLIKPFAFAELLARIRALVRRGRVAEAPRLAAGDLEVELITRKVTRGGQPIELTVREFELLEYLLRHQGQVVSRELLARDVWKETARTTPLDNVIDVHIARLRRKVDADQPSQADSHRARRRIHAPRGRAVTRWWRSHSVRVRLTLWYVAAMVVVLGVYAALVFVFVSRNASAALDSRLRGDFQWASAMIDQTPEGGITWYEMEELTEEERPWLQVWSVDGQRAVSELRGAAASAARKPASSPSVRTTVSSPSRPPTRRCAC